MSRRGELGWLGSLATTAGKPLLRALASTWRYEFRNRDALLSLRKQQAPFVFSLWHGHLLPLVWLHRNEGVRILISEHRDGEIIARIAHALGYSTIRGSTKKGGERALLALARALETGEEVAVTPDGPRGPARKSQPGALVAAARAGAAILPIVVHAPRAWRMNSWDRFIVPKPFARVIVAYGDPLLIAGGSARSAAAEAPRLDAAMRAAEEAATV
ncbi:MAG TPA: DUF374 domain-containing protein [Gemmatimonadaceae bacterium]